MRETALPKSANSRQFDTNAVPIRAHSSQAEPVWSRFGLTLAHNRGSEAGGRLAADNFVRMAGMA